MAEHIDFEGSCCWKVYGRKGEKDQKFLGPKHKVKGQTVHKSDPNYKNFKPKYPYITKLKTKKCKTEV